MVIATTGTGAGASGGDALTPAPAEATGGGGATEAEAEGIPSAPAELGVMASVFAGSLAAISGGVSTGT